MSKSKKVCKPIIVRKTILLSDLKNLAETAYFMHLRDNKTWIDKPPFIHRFINKYKLENPEIMVIRNDTSKLSKNQRIFEPKKVEIKKVKIKIKKKINTIPSKSEKVSRKEQERSYAKMLADTSDRQIVNPLPKKGVVVSYK